MFCERCGSELRDGAKFCTTCGVAAPGAFEGAVEPSGALRGQQDAGTSRANDAARTPEERRAQRRRRALVAVLAVLVLAGGGAALYLFADLGIFDDAATSAQSESALTLEAYYTNGSSVVVAASTLIVPYSLEDEPLTSYQAVLTPADDETSPSWGSATLEVSGADGFALQSVTGIKSGSYTLSITDHETGDVYQTPGLTLTNSESFDQLILKPDPTDPEQSLAADEPAYSYTMVTTSVCIEYHNGDASETVTNDWTYPQFYGVEENEALDELNEALATDFDEALEAAQNWTEDSADAQCLSYQATVTYLEDHVASVRTEVYATSWGAHGSTTVTGAIYDLETGERLTPESVIGLSSAERRTAAIEALNAYLESNPSDLYDADELADTIESIAKTTNRYYLASEGLVVVAGEYELGSFAYGLHEVVAVAFAGEALVGTEL